MYYLRNWVDNKEINSDQDKAAKKLGISRMHLWRLLNGKVGNPNLDLVVSLIDIAGLSLEEIKFDFRKRIDILA